MQHQLLRRPLTPIGKCSPQQPASARVAADSEDRSSEMVRAKRSSGERRSFVECAALTAPPTQVTRMVGRSLVPPQRATETNSAGRTPQSSGLLEPPPNSAVNCRGAVHLTPHLEDSDATKEYEGATRYLGLHDYPIANRMKEKKRACPPPGDLPLSGCAFLCHHLHHLVRGELGLGWAEHPL